MNLIISSTSPVEIQIENTITSSVNRVTLPGVHSTLDFDCHESQIFKKATSKKLHALSRVCKFIDRDKRRMITKAFIISKLSDCPLVWMFHSRNKENRVNKYMEHL